MNNKYGKINNFDDFKKFIEDNDIKSKQDFRKRFYRCYERLKINLSKEEIDKLFPSITKTYDDLKKFIEDNKITKRKILEKSSNEYYKLFLSLSTEERDNLIPLSCKDYSNINTFYDFKNFIEDNKIISRLDFQKRFHYCYSKFLKLTKEDQDNLLPTIYSYYRLNTFYDFKKFIEDNKIKSRHDFENRFSKGYSNFKRKLSKEEQNNLLPLLRNDYSNVNTFDDFKKFIEDNKIKSRHEFIRCYQGCYKKFKKLSSKEQELLLPLKIDSYISCFTFEDFDKFIREHNIKSRAEFKSKYPKNYINFRNKLSKEEKDMLLPLLLNNYENINTLFDFDKFIKENCIKSRDEFDKRFKVCYLKFLKVLSKEEQCKLLPVNIKSSGEVFISELLTRLNFKFTEEKRYADLFYKNHLRFDFYLEDLGILIEYHGPQHFDPNNRIYTAEGIERDKLKYEYAKQNNIPILYFTNEVEIYKKYGYFTEVITDVNILIERINEIKEIGLTSQSNS